MEKRHNATHLQYFYAGDDASIYDATVRMTDRAYDLIHGVTIRTLHCWFNNLGNTSSDGAPLWIVDVGCGTGAEAMQILMQVPDCHILCIDSSRAMLDEFRAKVRRAYGNDSANGSLAFAEADFRESGWLDTALAEARSVRIPNGFAAAVSVYALHHLLPEVKHDVYRTLFERLQANSLFVNADLFAFATPWLSQIAQEEEELWIDQQFGGGIPQSVSMAATLGPSRYRLREAWLDHLRRENIPLPITAANRASGEELLSEERLLREVGFATIEVPARLYQSAVLIATK